MNGRRILLVPSVAKGNGSGHIIRCFSLTRALGPGAVVFISDEADRDSWSAAELSLAYARELSGIEVATELSAETRWSLVILDRRASSAEEVAFWERLGPVISLDEGGSGRSLASYLVDILPRSSPPRSPSRRKAVPTDEPNLSALSFLDLPATRREPPRAFRRVLISFGGEDPAGLTALLARSLMAEKLFRPEDLTIVSGPLRRGEPPLGLDGVMILGPVQDLKEHLARYDLVFTQFGLTAFEAAYAGCGVILLNPGFYHQALARRAGFPEVGVLAPDLKALRSYLADPEGTLALSSEAAPKEGASLPDFLAGLEPSGPRGCPRCASFARQALWRSREKSYFRCRSCGLVYLERFSPGREAPYRQSYFFDEYRAQYGKTYLEDWPALSRMASARLDVIESLAERGLGRRKGLTLLDVGCAYGPFVAEAKKRGHEPYGLDMADDAARYVRSELGIPAAAGDFLDPAVAAAFGGPFDALSMWYVIEHFVDLDQALRNAAALVRPGGVFAFSTPSGEGVSARLARNGFFERSPSDHFTIWEPSRVKGILKAYGFRVETIHVTGHHPERFPIAAKGGSFGKSRPVLWLLGLASRALGLGDTFEVYAVREPVGEDGGLPTPGGKREARKARQS
jgi:2-polyprenyl-3-methyl-5-hydroxy-6-metoxy-1,4-benzoquinol methylase